jgi:hypothetical protein
VLGCTDTDRYDSSFYAALVTDGPILLQPVAALGDLVDPEDLQHLCQRRYTLLDPSFHESAVASRYRGRNA